MTVQKAGATAQGSGIPTKDFQLPEYLYSRLRDVDRERDDLAGQSVDVVKRERPSIDDSMVPVEVRPEPQLKRFLRLLGAPFNYTRTQIESTLTMIDVERCEAKWLNSIAKIIGWELNNE